MLTPIDIQNKDFEVKFRGYDTGDVDDFMDMILKDYEKQYKENIELKDKINMINEELKRYKAMESTLQNSIILAQSASEDIRKNASIQAENIIKEADIKATNIIKKCNEKISSEKNELTAIKMEVSTYKARMRGICAGLSLMIDKIDDNF